MTQPDNTQNAELRKRWWQRYLNQQAKQDTAIRQVLKNGASDAVSRIQTLANNSTFSAGVRTTQIKMALNEIQKTHKDIFGDILPIVTNGQKNAASAAMAGLTETDLQYIRDAAGSAHDASAFIKSAQQTALNNVTAAVQRIQGFNYPLSTRVYRTQSLANRWVQNTISNALVRGDSAKDLADAVKSSILPTTPGGTSYAAMRLGRTELNNAFHATAITSSEDRPWITGMRWYLSDTHKIDDLKPEICETYAGQVFPVQSTPGKPHPQCRCYVAPEVISIEQFNANLTDGTYNDWIEDNVSQAA